MPTTMRLRALDSGSIARVLKSLPSSTAFVCGRLDRFRPALLLPFSSFPTSTYPPSVVGEMLQPSVWGGVPNCSLAAACGGGGGTTRHSATCSIDESVASSSSRSGRPVIPGILLPGGTLRSVACTRIPFACGFRGRTGRWPLGGSCRPLSCTAAHCGVSTIFGVLTTGTALGLAVAFGWPVVLGCRRCGCVPMPLPRCSMRFTASCLAPRSSSTACHSRSNASDASSRSHSMDVRRWTGWTLVGS